MFVKKSQSWPTSIRASPSTGSGIFASGATYTAFTDVASLPHLPGGTAFADVPSNAPPPRLKSRSTYGMRRPSLQTRQPTQHPRPRSGAGALETGTTQRGAGSMLDLGKFQLLKISMAVLFLSSVNF